MLDWLVLHLIMCLFHFLYIYIYVIVGVNVHGLFKVILFQSNVVNADSTPKNDVDVVIPDTVNLVELIYMLFVF